MLTSRRITIQLLVPEETGECTFPRGMELCTENLEMEGDAIKAALIKLPSGNLHRIPCLPFTFQVIAAECHDN